MTGLLTEEDHGEESCPAEGAWAAGRPILPSPGVITDAGEGAEEAGSLLTSTLITPPHINPPPSIRTPAPPHHLQLLIIPTQRPKPSKGILSHERYPAKSSPNTTLIWSWVMLLPEPLTRHTIKNTFLSLPETRRRNGFAETTHFVSVLPLIHCLHLSCSWVARN